MDVALDKERNKELERMKELNVLLNQKYVEMTQRLE